MLFVGTSHGRLLKLSSDSNTLIEALQVFPYHVPVRNILVADEQIIGIIFKNYEIYTRVQKFNHASSCLLIKPP